MKKDIVVYGADWCGDTVRTRRQLDDEGITYTYIDIDQDKEGEAKVIEFNKGKRRIPMVEIGEDRLSVPDREQLFAKLDR